MNISFLRRVRNRLLRVLCGDRARIISSQDKGRAFKNLLMRFSDFELAVRVLQTRRFQRPIPPTFVSCPKGQRLLILAPHQDDEIIGCGGLVLHAVREGKEILPIYLSDGKNNVPGHCLEDVPELRKQEALKVWRKIGDIIPVFWNIPNKQFEVSEEIAQRIYKVLHEFKPDCLFVPFFLEDPDAHRKTNQMLFMAREYGELPDMRVWAYQVSTMISPNYGVEISDVAKEKYELMRMWESQNKVFDYAHYTKGLNIYNSFFYKKGGVVAPQVELFFVVPLMEYFELLEGYFGNNDENNLYGSMDEKSNSDKV